MLFMTGDARQRFFSFRYARASRSGGDARKAMTVDYQPTTYVETKVYSIYCAHVNVMVPVFSFPSTIDADEQKKKGTIT